MAGRLPRMRAAASFWPSCLPDFAAGLARASPSSSSFRRWKPRPARKRRYGWPTKSPVSQATISSLPGKTGVSWNHPGAALSAAVQIWLNQGRDAGIILDSVKQQVGRFRGEKIGSADYFEKGIARFIASRKPPRPGWRSLVSGNRKPGNMAKSTRVRNRTGGWSSA